MRASLDALADLLADAVAGATCEVARVVVTAGRPAAPSGEGEECQTAIYVYGDNVTDLNQVDPDACQVKTRWAMLYEIWTCYPEAWDDVTDAQHESAADCLYELMELAWCATVEARDSGIPFGTCDDVELVPLQVQTRSGTAVSAIGGLTIPFECPAPADSPTSPTSP